MQNTQAATAAIANSVDALEGELFGFAQQLVRTRSLPGEEKAAHALVATKLESMGLDVRVVSSTLQDLENHPAFCDDGIPVEQRVNVVGRWRGHGNDRVAPCRSLIVNGHLDVVSPGNEALWETSPWSGLIRNGRLFGRGACDMKSGVSAGIFAIAALQRIGIVLDGDVLLECVSGEESGGVGTLSTIVNGYTADAAIILEPTTLKLCPVQSGALTFRLRVAGRSVHACMKNKGVNAIEKVCRLLDAIEALDHERHRAYENPLYGDPTNVAPISIGTIRGGDWHSTVPNEVTVEGRLGVFPNEPLADAKESLARAIRQAGSHDPWLRDHPPQLEWFEGQFESGSTQLDSPILGTLAESHRAVTGRAARIEGVTYGSDLRLFTNHARIPAVLYGPGDVVNAHTVDEFIDLDEVVAATKVLALTISQWCGGRTS